MNEMIKHFEFIALFVTMVSCFCILDSKLERQIQTLDQRLETLGQRTDRLYEMFIDLVKENRE